MVTQSRIDVRTSRGTMPVHVHAPAGAGLEQAPMVVLFMDAPGVRPALHAYAEQLAEAGFTAALPDLFYAVAPAERPRLELIEAGDPQEFKRMSGLAASLHDDQVHEDLGALLAQLRESAAADAPRPWGCVGFCMGGRFALRAAEDFADELAVAAMLHPSRIVTDAPDSPHLAVDGIDAALYFAWAEHDHVSPPELIPPLSERLDAARVEHEIELIPGVRHGFTMRGMPAFDESAARHAWSRTLATLERHLGGGRT